jgi:hypothetical protein
MFCLSKLCGTNFWRDQACFSVSQQHDGTGGGVWFGLDDDDVSLLWVDDDDDDDGVMLMITAQGWMKGGDGDDDAVQNNEMR